MPARPVQAHSKHLQSGDILPYSFRQFIESKITGEDQGEEAMSIEQEIDNLIQKTGANYREWYVGLAINPRQRLFSGHNVNEQSGAWLFRDAGSEATARDLETIFLKKGCKGGALKRDSSRHIYAYKMTRTTRGSVS